MRTELQTLFKLLVSIIRTKFYSLMYKKALLYFQVKFWQNKAVLLLLDDIDIENLIRVFQTILLHWPFVHRATTQHKNGSNDNKNRSNRGSPRTGWRNLDLPIPRSTSIQNISNKGCFQHQLCLSSHLYHWMHPHQYLCILYQHVGDLRPMCDWADYDCCTDINEDKFWVFWDEEWVCVATVRVLVVPR